ncbi:MULTISPECIES: DUF58 domain-containing protein [Acidiphilium]|uniref:DUF58 domain-containing protein n=1 Tax=Acidiphilium rubrum TaxID=526 RepID=A0A8G2CMT9_ACIRU|nr:MULTISPECIES: DUF58 domain-containing protein [Acidiphilium]SIR31149.1 Protein of unknown function DUF58 [Acidiphilium rubrum]
MADHRASARSRIAAAEALAARLPALVLAAQRLAASAAPGRHGRRRAGAGEQFWQYRDVRDGDSPASIDWRRSARGERLYVREREWESVETLVIDVQDHEGMDFTGQTNQPTKRDRALLLALALAALALDGGERVALFGRTPAFGGPGALDRLAAGFMLAASTTPVAGRLALIGDFLAPPEAIAADLARHGAAGRGGVLVQVLDGAECDFPYRGRVLFERRGEAAEDIARAEDIAAAYRARLAAQRDAVIGLAEAARLVPLLHRTDAAPGPALAAIRAGLEPVS